MESSPRTEEDRGHSFKSSVFTFRRHNGGGGDYQMSQQRKVICGRFIQVGYSLVRNLVFIFPYFILFIYLFVVYLFLFIYLILFDALID